MNIKEVGTQQMLTKNMADHNKMTSVWATAPWTLQQPTDVIIHWILWNFYTQMSKYCCYWHILGAWLWILYWTPAWSWSGSRSMFPLRLQEEIQTFKWETETEKIILLEVWFSQSYFSVVRGEKAPRNKVLPPRPPVRPVAPLWLWPRWSAVTRGGNMMEADGWNRREGGIWQIIPPP